MRPLRLLLFVAACSSNDKPVVREAPTPAPGDAAVTDPVVHLASGDGGVCATRASGRSYCWGPVGLRGAVEPVHLVAGDATAVYPRFQRPCIDRPGAAPCASGNGLGGCAIANGQVSCSGARQRSSGDPIEGIERPIQLHLRALYAGGCALEAGGAVTCWGELDDRSGKAFVPTRTHGFGSLAKLAPWGVDSMCALRATGEVACWNAHDLVEVLEGKPATPLVTPGLMGDPWVSVVENCALRASGRVACWGDNREGQVTGVGDVREQAARLVDPPRVRRFAAFSEDPWCAVVDDGSVVCWPTASQRPAVHLPPPASAGDEVQQIVQAGPRVCALLARGTVTCFSREDSSQAAPAPQTVPELTDAIAISASARRICALRRVGSVACGVASARARPLVTVQGIDDAIAIAVSSSFGCALRRGGTVRCWSDEHAVDPVGLPPVAQIDVARDTQRPYVCGVGADGAVWCWGGRGCTERACRVPDVADVVEVAAGPTDGERPVFHARTRAGRVLTWGEYDEHTVVHRDDIADAKALRAGRYATCVVDTGDAVRCWGDVRELLNDGHRSVVTDPVEVVLP